LRKRKNRIQTLPERSEIGAEKIIIIIKAFQNFGI